MAGCGKRKDIPSSNALESPPADPWQMGVIWEGAEVITRPRPAEPIWVRLTVANPGPSIWPDPQLANPVDLDGSWAVRVGYRFWDEGGSTLVTDYRERIDLPGPVVVGQRIDLLIPMYAPVNPGKYLLQVDLLRESIGWFEANGSPKFQIPVEVRP